MVKRSTKSRRAGSAVDQLQAALTRSLKESVSEAVSSVCESFQQAVEEQAAAGASTGEESGGYDVYYNNCRRLVDYIHQHMKVSPGFVEQMDRIILACHSGATERVLSSVVTKQLWFHKRGAMEKETLSSSSGSSNRSAAKKKAKKESLAPSSSSRMATRASTESPAMHTRSALGSKRTATRGSVHDDQPVKRPRRAARKMAHYSSEEEEEKEEEEPEKPRRRRKKQEEEDDDDALLSFKDAIGELCYPDRRSPSETKFFKERLRKSIQFVDALLCKPPKGKVCGRGCKKIRAQMCSSSTPCKNTMCRIWHDVEAHTDRCQNPQCEFKNRILLRETMHKLEIKQQQITELKVDLEGKQGELKEAADDDKEELENEIASLEHDLDEYDEELSVLEGTKNTFWGNLNEIGIEVQDDAVDSFPDFATHYEEKKATPRKARSAVAASTSYLSSATSRNSRAAARHAGAGPHGDHSVDEDEADDADAESVGDNIPRRTARRSTSSGPNNAPPEHESDEETKGGDEKDEVSHHEDLLPGPDEPPLPPAGPPPFRQNPELDREFAVSASGYSIHPPADDLEAPALAMDSEPIHHAETTDAEITQKTVVDESTRSAELQALQRQSEEISGIMAGLGAIPPAAEIAATPETLNTTGFTIRGNQPQNS